MIYGATNAGKSSLLNRLLGFPRAIVSEVPGTTRDTIEELVNLRGIALRLTDTAGLRATTADAIENEGISRTERSLAQADLVLHVVDASAPQPAHFEPRSSDVASLLLLNKSDLPAHEDWKNYDALPISCTTENGLTGLEEAILAKVSEQRWDVPSAVAINARHRDCLRRALAACDEARQCLGPKARAGVRRGGPARRAPGSRRSHRSYRHGANPGRALRHLLHRQMKRLTSDWYEHFVRPALFRMEPEKAHHFALNCLRRAPQIPGALALLRSFAPPPQPRTLFGLSFPNPIGLAAGFDKNGVAIPAWEALGFGFVEIGTVTAQGQPGNPAPRIFRYPQQSALINRLGFNNDGADVVAARLRKLRQSSLRPSIPIGVNLGKSKATPLEEAPADYLYSFRQLHSVADYIVLNVSSPNTPGLRSLQEHAALVALLRAITGENARLSRPKPILLKIAPDLSDESLEEILGAVEEFGLAGLIATNTTLDHSAIAPAADEVGGLSGAPLRERATAVVRFLRSRTQLPIIASGGVADPDSGREKIAAGAQLLQIYTGLVYRGPNLISELARLASLP